MFCWKSFNKRTERIYNTRILYHYTQTFVFLLLTVWNQNTAQVTTCHRKTCLWCFERIRLSRKRMIRRHPSLLSRWDLPRRTGLSVAAHTALFDTVPATKTITSTKTVTNRDWLMCLDCATKIIINILIRHKVWRLGAERLRGHLKGPLRVQMSSQDRRIGASACRRLRVDDNWLFQCQIFFCGQVYLGLEPVVPTIYFFEFLFCSYYYSLLISAKSVSTNLIPSTRLGKVSPG